MALWRQLAACGRLHLGSGAVYVQHAVSGGLMDVRLWAVACLAQKAAGRLAPAAHRAHLPQQAALPLPGPPRDWLRWPPLVRPPAPQALDTILKERVFRAARARLSVDLDLFVVNTAGSLAQVFIFSDAKHWLSACVAPPSTCCLLCSTTSRPPLRLPPSCALAGRFCFFALARHHGAAGLGAGRPAPVRCAGVAVLPRPDALVRQRLLGGAAPAAALRGRQPGFQCGGS